MPASAWRRPCCWCSRACFRGSAWAVSTAQAQRTSARWRARSCAASTRASSTSPSSAASWSRCSCCSCSSDNSAPMHSRIGAGAFHSPSGRCSPSPRSGFAGASRRRLRSAPWRRARSRRRRAHGSASCCAIPDRSPLLLGSPPVARWRSTRSPPTRRNSSSTHPASARRTPRASPRLR